MAHRDISLLGEVWSVSGIADIECVFRTDQARLMSTRPSLSLCDESQTTVKCISLSADHDEAQQLTSAWGLKLGQRRDQTTFCPPNARPARISAGYFHVAGRSFLPSSD